MIQSIDRAIDILLALRSAPADGLFTMEISRTTGLSKAVCYNILKTLKARGVIEQSGNGGRYTLSRMFFSFSGGVFDDVYLKEQLVSTVHRAAEHLKETVSLVALRRNFELEILVREHVDHEIILSPNRYKPLYTTASGRCLLAGLDDAELETFISKEGLPEKEIWTEASTIDGLKNSLAQIRESGSVQIISDERHVAAFGCMFRNAGKFAPLAMGFAMPLFRYEKISNSEMVKIFDTYCQSIENCLEKIQE